MVQKITSADYVDNHRIRIEFANGVRGTIDLQNELWGQVFEPLKDIEEFRKFRLDTELNTIVWETGADLAPEFLYEQVLAQQDAASDTASPSQ